MEGEHREVAKVARSQQTWILLRDGLREQGKGRANTYC
jgi:hypothetical protein